MIILEKVALFFRERWKHLLVFYMVGYVISVAQTGVPSWQYWIPLKNNAVAIGWGMGNGSYLVAQERKKRGGGRSPIYFHYYNGIKYGISMILLTGIYALLISIVGVVFNFDSKPFH
ncbi:hypothetical protein [Azotosporobacter soli]|uniref:hypothetical protein n=1 Tax=Azotosporobacter soli TaxID=3055040 RepID=UPI0031FF3ADA